MDLFAKTPLSEKDKSETALECTSSTLARYKTLTPEDIQFRENETLEERMESVDETGT